MPEDSRDTLVSTAQRLLIEDQVLLLRIGVGDQERATPQRILLSLAVEVEPAAPTRDSVDEVVDYGVIARGARALAERSLAERGEVKLLETLARDIARLALADRRVRTVEVTLRKPDLFSDIAAVGIVQKFARVVEPEKG